MPSSDAPLRGSCACGAVRFRVTAPFKTAGYCHCTRCQRRTGALWSVNGQIDADGFELLEGADAVRTWRPSDGIPKSFCAHCGGHVYSGSREPGGTVGVRLGTLESDPGIRPRWHQWLDSAPEWAPVPDDGLPRYARRREAE